MTSPTNSNQITEKQHAINTGKPCITTLATPETDHSTCCISLTPKNRMLLTVLFITTFSFLLAFIIIVMSITFGICHSLLGSPDLHIEIYILLLALSAIFIIIGVITLVVGWRLWRGKYNVNNEGVVVNSNGERIDVLGEAKSSEMLARVDSFDSELSIKI